LLGSCRRLTVAQFAYNLRFPGQYYQAETGLNQNYFRDYDPTVGRYVESDPMGLIAGINTYAYVMSQPISRVDSTGLAIDPTQTCINGLGIGCKGQQNNPNVPGTPTKPKGPRFPKEWCAQHTIDAVACAVCCGDIAKDLPWYQFNWQSQCNAECAREFAACPKRPRDPVGIPTDPVAVPASLGSF
jgi:RHS repeat-associated protein